MAFFYPRLALGASWASDSFDGTQILALCYGDPDLTPPMVYSKVSYNSIGIFNNRQVANSLAPRAFRRTGYGAKQRFDIEIAYETAVPPTWFLGFPGSNGGADASLDGIASILGRSAPGFNGTAGNPWPPYLFLTLTYQTNQEQWFAVEIDPTAGDPELDQPYLYAKNNIRMMSISLVSVQTWQQIQVLYSLYQQMTYGIGTANVPTTPGGSPPYTTVITLSNTHA